MEPNIRKKVLRFSVVIRKGIDYVYKWCVDIYQEEMEWAYFVDKKFLCILLYGTW